MGVFSSCKILLCSSRDRLWPVHHRGKISGTSGNSVAEKIQDEELIWILPKAVMAIIRHHRLWFQPLNEPDQCCRSNTLVLNMPSVNCVFLSLLPHMRGSPPRSQCFSNVRRDVSQKALRDLGKGGCCRKEWRPKTHTANASWTHSLGCMLSSMEALLFLLKGYFFLSLDKANNFSHALFTSRQAARTYLCLWLQPLLSKTVLLFYLLIKHFYYKTNISNSQTNFILSLMLADNDSICLEGVSVAWCPDFGKRCYTEGRAGCPCATVAVIGPAHFTSLFV